MLPLDDIQLSAEMSFSIQWSSSLSSILQSFRNDLESLAVSYDMSNYLSGLRAFADQSSETVNRGLIDLYHFVFG
jgi:hypothetical protein